MMLLRFYYVPDTVTKAEHIWDGMDLKGLMTMVVLALTLCYLYGTTMLDISILLRWANIQNFGWFHLNWYSAYSGVAYLHCQYGCGFGHRVLFCSQKRTCC